MVVRVEGPYVEATIHPRNILYPPYMQCMIRRKESKKIVMGWRLSVMYDIGRSSWVSSVMRGLTQNMSVLWQIWMGWKKLPLLLVVELFWICVA